MLSVLFVQTSNDLCSAFGESFECLTTATLHTWVKIFFALAKNMAYAQMISRFPYLLRLPIAMWLIPSKVRSDAKTLNELQIVSSSTSLPIGCRSVCH